MSVLRECLMVCLLPRSTVARVRLFFSRRRVPHRLRRAHRLLTRHCGIVGRLSTAVCTCVRLLAFLAKLKGYHDSVATGALHSNVFEPLACRIRLAMHLLLDSAVSTETVAELPISPSSSSNCAPACKTRWCVLVITAKQYV